MSELVKNIDKNTKYSTTKLHYPYIFVENATDPVALVLESLDAGEVPLVIKHNGVLLSLGTFSGSPLILKRLLAVTPFDIYKAENVVVHVSTAIDLLEAGIWME